MVATEYSLRFGNSDPSSEENRLFSRDLHLVLKGKSLFDKKQLLQAHQFEREQ
jgi:hypothetical protein